MDNDKLTPTQRTAQSIFVFLVANWKWVLIGLLVVWVAAPYFRAIPAPIAAPSVANVTWDGYEQDAELVELLKQAESQYDRSTAKVDSLLGVNEQLENEITRLMAVGNKNQKNYDTQVQTYHRQRAERPARRAAPASLDSLKSVWKRKFGIEQ
jgi:hypothetical protein